MTNDATTDVRQTIRCLEDERYAAMFSKDIATLDRLLDEGLVYMHSSGVTDTKASYLGGLGSGLWDYRGVERDDVRIDVDGDVALVFAKLTIELVTNDAHKSFATRALAVWHRKGEAWRLLAVHSGALPPAG
ncbi:nuclear transport factor 2 family protein [Paraburkholderia sp. A3BS-1L]|uniref:nuclear transport factor 2 family protein n=1 Tax=Paraburkholderia sp. A3BS-1L TaxID=3028375 RepID=UPI003DA99E2E